MTDTNIFKIAAIQMSCSDVKKDNIAKAVSLVQEASGKGAKVICLPELFSTRYFCQTEDTEKFDLAETIPGETTKQFSDIAAKHKVIIIVPIFEKRAAGVYHNSLVVIDERGEILSKYRKMHIPDDPGYYEKYYFTPGDEGFSAVATSAGKIGTLICWDQWFPEAARIVALNGARIVFYPTAIGWHPSEKEQYGQKQRDAWMTVQRGHAIANGVYVAAVNRVGFEPRDSSEQGIEFWGSSFICGPQGEVVISASDCSEEIIYAEVNPAEIEEIRRNWPFLRDRRIEHYSKIYKRVID